MTSDLIAPGTPGFALVCLAGLAVLINGLTFVAFGLDKRRAEAGEWRVPERVLLLLALIGGSPGAKLAQHWYCHKTRKQPFRALLNAILVLHLGVTLAITTPIVPRAVDLVQGTAQRFGAEPPRLGAIPWLGLGWWFGEHEAKNEHQRVPGLVRRFGRGSAGDAAVPLF